MRRLAQVAPLLFAACGSPRAGGTSPDAAPPDAPRADVWAPRPGTSWQWQLSGTIDTSLDVAMYDVDLFDAPDAVLADLRGRGIAVVCYVNAGAREDWRADAGDFPAEVVGAPLAGWPGENWLDVRAPAVRAIMQARLDRAAARGCTGVEPDNVDGYTNATGFPLTAADQLDYDRFLAAEAHARGLSVGLKNDLDQIPDLVGDFDWALDEQCHQYSECDALAPFVAGGKAVFNAEYGDASLAASVCPDANARDFDTLIKNLNLDAFRIACR